jgi:hypothetical protein
MKRKAMDDVRLYSIAEAQFRLIDELKVWL